MRMARWLTLIGIAVVVTTAGAHAQSYVKGNDTGGIITWSCESEAAAAEIAAAHCAGYGKYPRITSVHRQYGDMIGFNCLWSPHIAHFAIPAVRTRRSACAAVTHGPALRVKY